MDCIIRELEHMEGYGLELSKHAEEGGKLELVSKLAKPYRWYEVYRFREGEIQVHCLLEDCSVLVYNKDSKCLITILILEPKNLKKYMRSGDVTLEKIAKLNKKSKASKVSKGYRFREEDVEIYLRKKEKLFCKKC